MLIPAFPKIFHLGDARVLEIFNDPVEITEKLDGSQFSFGKINGELKMRSKGAEITEQNCPKMFNKAVNFAIENELLIPEGYIFHGEFFDNPKHNTLEYGRIPRGHFALFGVRSLQYDIMEDYPSLEFWANELKCETIPLIFEGRLNPENAYDFIMGQMEKESVLGRAQMEGVVIKNYNKRTIFGDKDFPVMACKFVSEQFKEKHKVNPEYNKRSAIELMGIELNAEPRWLKAIQAMRDEEQLTSSPKDIGPLMERIIKDIEEEEIDSLKNKLWKIHRKVIMNAATKGMPQWYKEKLAKDGLQKMEDVAGLEALSDLNKLIGDTNACA